MKKSILRGSFVFSLLLGMVSLFAQRPVIYDSPAYEYNTALELFQKKQYGSAQEYFKYVYENTTDRQYDMKSNSYFYRGVCASLLDNEDAAFLLKEFIRKYPIHSFVPDAHFYIARFYFAKKQYKKALENFKEIDERNIKTEDLAEYNFKKGYAFLVAEDYDEAKYLFREARKYDGQYQQKAVYYLAHIAYEEKQYEAALNDFLTLQNIKEYADVVPFYITQIYFIQGEYEKIIASIPELKTQNADKMELNRIIALSYYNLGKYNEAVPYMNDFINQSTTQKAGASEPGRSDLYAIGYTFYKTRQYSDAVTFLSKVTDNEDAMTQNAYYVIGDCYLKQDKLNLATQNFFEASKFDFIPEIQEDALYNYAKLQYQTASVPFSSAIKALEDYINRYPHSTRSEEATTYLSKIYASTKNYREAISSIEKINSKSPALMKSYQRCTHFRALELINNREYKNAVKMIEKSMIYPLDPTIQFANLYWKAESEFRADEFKKSYNSFQVYHKTQNISSDVNYPISYYSFGYAALKLQKYKEAQDAFEKFLTFPIAEEDEDYQADALARLGDCYFMQKKLQSAISNYEKCARMKMGNADYALYQQAKCYGYLQNDSKKIELLEKFIQYYDKSAYIDEVEFELASTYHSQNQYALAINAYQNFIKKHPSSPYVREAHNKLAQAYLNAQNTEMSIATFKKVIELYPGSQEAKDALANLENIYTDLGQTGEFFDYIKSKGNIHISAERQDSISYKAVENKYLKGNCEMAIQGFQDYLKNFPNGFFAAQAYFYKAECEYGMNSYDQALVDYEALINNYRTKDNEVALRKAATILYNKNEYQRALAHFNGLLKCASSDNNISYAYNGMMRCAFELKNYQEALEAAKGYLNSEQTDPELKDDAQLIAGKSAFFLNDYLNAQKYLSVLSHKSTNDLSAEAAYYCALIEYNQGNYDACEKIITEILAAKYSSSYWLASTFILYGDFYVAKGNNFQARHTYQSIVDNYDGEDLREIARQKIAQIDQSEKPVAPQPGENENLKPIDEDEED